MSWTKPAAVWHILQRHHYLGGTLRGIAWNDDYGVMILGAPTSRNIPGNWLELLRWCITSQVKNAGSRQFAAMIRALRRDMGYCTTLVSYSDPSAGHDGALYRACNWLWAPTWHRLRPPPTGNGAWSEGDAQAVKDRWVFPVKHDPHREGLLVAQDDAVLRKMPYARYTEPRGACYRTWKQLNFQDRSRRTRVPQEDAEPRPGGLDLFEPI